MTQVTVSNTRKLVEFSNSQSSTSPTNSVQTQAHSKTCANCPYFQDFNENSGRGLCHSEDKVVKSHHRRTSICEVALAEIPHEIGTLVKLIDPGEPHSEWAEFRITSIRYNPARFASTEGYLNESTWNCQLESLDRKYSFWVGEQDFCESRLAWNVMSEDEF